MEADEKMVLAGILRWDREGMHATFKCPHADGGEEKTKPKTYFNNAHKA